MSTEISSEQAFLMGINHLADLDLVGRKTLLWMLIKLSVQIWSRFVYLRIGSSGVYVLHSGESPR